MVFCVSKHIKPLTVHKNTKGPPYFPPSLVNTWSSLPCICADVKLKVHWGIFSRILKLKFMWRKLGFFFDFWWGNLAKQGLEIKLYYCLDTHMNLSKEFAGSFDSTFSNTLDGMFPTIEILFQSYNMLSIDNLFFFSKIFFYINLYSLNDFSFWWIKK